MTRECGCSRPCREGFTLCDTCRDDLEQHLAEMRWVDEQLDISLTRAHGIDYAAMGGARSTDTPLPWNDRASRVRAELRAELVSWVRILRQDAAWPADRLPDLAAWLMKRLPVIAKHDEAWTIHQGITGASQKARAIVFAKPEEQRLIGVCDGRIEDDGETITETACDGSVYALASASTGDCRKCGRTYDADTKRTEMLALLDDKLANKKQIARLLGYLALPAKMEAVRAQMYRLMAPKDDKPARILAKSHEPDGTELFNFGEVRDMLEKHYRDKAV